MPVPPLSSTVLDANAVTGDAHDLAAPTSILQREPSAIVVGECCSVSATSTIDHNTQVVQSPTVASQRRSTTLARRRVYLVPTIGARTEQAGRLMLLCAQEMSVVWQRQLVGRDFRLRLNFVDIANRAKRETCNVCAAKNTNLPKEERYGAGGGHKENANIEYIERGESDDEVDDFGRKKKQFRGTAPLAAGIVDPDAAKVAVEKFVEQAAKVVEQAVVDDSKARCVQRVRL
jgi:hypothetical protein